MDLLYAGEDVVKYVISKLGTDVKVNCEELQVRSQNYRSFKISIPASEGGKLLSGDFWPPGIAVRKFINLKRHQQSGNGPHYGLQSQPSDSGQGQA